MAGPDAAAMSALEDAGLLPSSDWLDEQSAAGARLTLGIPRVDAAVDARWIGRRLAWWPCGVPHGRRVGLASSRLGRKLDSKRAWFRMLRAACAKTDPQHDLLLTATSTAAAKFVERSAHLFGRRLLRLNVPPDDEPLTKWVSRIQRHDSAESDLVYDVFLSPPVKNRPSPSRSLDAPARDRVLVALSDSLLAFHIRPRGSLHGLVKARLKDDLWTTGSVYLALGDGLVDRRVADEFMRLGAVGWYVVDETIGTEEAWGKLPACQAAPQAGSLRHKIVALPAAEGWDYLTHCTRRRHGPWPDEDEKAFLDDLILDRPSADHSSFAALWRIVRQQRIIGTSEVIRGDRPVVSFTEVPLARLDRLRSFRPHLGRWDFGPYGICIRRRWLQQHGARPVRYGDEELWDRLDGDDRAFFQLRHTSDGRIDWSLEREWRCPGNVDLKQLPHDGGYLFVSSEPEAHQLAQISRWPIVIVPC